MMLGGCALSPPPDERLHSTLWVQTSAEYAISTRQVYRLATDALGPALADPDRHGLESPLSAADLPPAIIVDVDETVLDNSGHTARMILARQGFTTESWRAWVREASAPAVPGAVHYLQAAAARGITVFYVTNRLLGSDDGPLEDRFGNKREGVLKFGFFDTLIAPTLGLGMIIDPTGLIWGTDLDDWSFLPGVGDYLGADQELHLRFWHWFSYSSSINFTS